MFVALLLLCPKVLLDCRISPKTVAHVAIIRFSILVWNATSQSATLWISSVHTTRLTSTSWTQNKASSIGSQKDDYESCKLSSAARELGRCTAPMRRDKVKVSFRLLSPNPSALDYRPGQSYYFISTSTGTPWGLDNTRGGLCSTSNLKMIIHVGAFGHHHRHHRKPVTSTTTEAPPEEDSDWPADPLWTQFFDKKNVVEFWYGPTLTRGERLSLDTGSRRHEYESVPMAEMDFQIHEIGEGSFISTFKSSLH
ncbi:Ephrin [Cooperia oncophora]